MFKGTIIMSTKINFTDAEYLNFITEIYSTYKTSYLYAIVNNDLRYVSVSNSFLEELNITDCYGKLLPELNTPLAKYGPFWGKVQEQFLSSQAPYQHMLLAHEVSNKIYVLQHFLNRLVNPYTTNTVGLLHSFNRIIANSAAAKILANKHDFIIIDENNNTKDVVLNESEYEILFLLSLGKSYKEISQILQKIYPSQVLSDKAIASRIKRGLYIKLNSSTVGELIEKAYLFGMLDKLPLSFMQLIETKIIII